MKYGLSSWKPRMRYAAVMAALIVAYGAGYATAVYVGPGTKGITMPTQRWPIEKYENVRVLKVAGPRVFKMQMPPNPAHGIDEPFDAWLTFCREFPDYSPPFHEGMMLTKFYVENRSSCYSLSPDTAGYTILKDDGGRVVLAKGEFVP